MAIACSVPVDAGRAGRRWQAFAWAVPAAGLATVCGLLTLGPPSWASPDPTTLWVIVQTLCGLSALLGLAGAVRMLLSGAAGAPRTESRVLHLGEAGLARLSEVGDEVGDGVGSDFASGLSDARTLRLVQVSALPGLIVVVLAPIYRDRPKLSGWRLLRTRVQILLIAEDALTAEQWRRLHVWLLWVRRAHGSHALS